MKKILTILTVALLACTTVFAAFNVTGEFEAGYKFGFNGGFSAEAQDNAEGKVTFKITDDAGIWTVNVKALDELDSSNKLDANLSLDIAALLAANGTDLGDFDLALSIGANSKMTALSAYNDVTGDELFKLKSNGAYSTELTIGYGDLVQAKIAVDPTAEVSKEMPIIVSAKTTPVEGVSVSAGYTYQGYMYLAAINPLEWVIVATDPDKEDEEKAEGVVDHGVTVAADVNVGTLADLDFNLGVTAYDNIGFNGKTVFNTLAAGIYGGVDVVDGFFEFRMDNYTVDKAPTTTVLGMKTQVNINVVENLGLDVYFNIGNFDEFNTTYAVGGDVSYTLSGVKFAANLDYAGTGGFSITPKIVVTF